MWSDEPPPDPADDEPGDLPPLAYASHTTGLPPEALRMGLDRNTEEGALIAMAGSLNSAKPAHRAVAWVILACFVAPLVLTLAREFF